MKQYPDPGSKPEHPINSDEAPPRDVMGWLVRLAYVPQNVTCEERVTTGRRNQSPISGGVVSTDCLDMTVRAAELGPCRIPTGVSPSVQRFVQVTRLRSVVTERVSLCFLRGDHDAPRNKHSTAPEVVKQGTILGEHERPFPPQAKP